MTHRRRIEAARAEPSPALSDRGTEPALQCSSGGRVALHDVHRGLLSVCSSCPGFKRPGGCRRDVAARWQRCTIERTDLWLTKAEGFFWCTSIYLLYVST